MKFFSIPNALQIDMDDMGWFCGTNDRPGGGPSRTGIPRRHTAADYLAVNELGRRLNMKINCAFVAGEWDPDNRLGNIPYFSKYGNAWNNAAYFDAELAKECAEILNASLYINLSVHGLMHGYYMDGTDCRDTSDYYYRINGQLYMVPEAEIRRRLEAFFALLDSHSIDKKVNTMIPPAFAYRWNELSYILKTYGIRYVGTIYSSMCYDEKGERPNTVGIEKSGIITYDRMHNPISWDMFGGPYETMPLLNGIIGVHWPNFLHECPERNMETVARAEAYFRRAGSVFGTILSRDVTFYVTQALYKHFAKDEEKDGMLILDLTAVPCADGMRDRFYVSSKKQIVANMGCTLSLYETHPTHFTYEVIPCEKILKLKV